MQALAAARRLGGTRRGTSVLIGGQEDGVDRPEHDADEGEVPQLDAVAEHQRGDDRRQDRAQDVRGEREVARRDPVGQDAAERA